MDDQRRGFSNVLFLLKQCIVTSEYIQVAFNAKYFIWAVEKYFNAGQKYLWGSSGEMYWRDAASSEPR